MVIKIKEHTDGWQHPDPQEQAKADALQARMFALVDSGEASFAWGISYLPFSDRDGGGWLLEDGEGDERLLFATVAGAEAAYDEALSYMRGEVRGIEPPSED